MISFSKECTPRKTRTPPKSFFFARTKRQKPDVPANQCYMHVQRLGPSKRLIIKSSFHQNYEELALNQILLRTSCTTLTKYKLFSTVRELYIYITLVFQCVPYLSTEILFYSMTQSSTDCHMKQSYKVNHQGKFAAFFTIL